MVFVCLLHMAFLLIHIPIWVPLQCRSQLLHQQRLWTRSEPNKKDTTDCGPTSFVPTIFLSLCNCLIPERLLLKSPFLAGTSTLVKSRCLAMFCNVLLCFACTQAVYLGQHPPNSASVGSLWSRWCCPLRAQREPIRPCTGVIYPAW